MMNFDVTRDFERDFKRLAKRYRSLEQDLADFKKVLAVIPYGNGRHFAVLVETDAVRIIKARLFCRYLKGSSLRVIYAYNEEAEHINFIELYFKGDHEAEDEERINEYLKTSNNP